MGHVWEGRKETMVFTLIYEPCGERKKRNDGVYTYLWPLCGKVKKKRQGSLHLSMGPVWEGRKETNEFTFIYGPCVRR